MGSAGRDISGYNFFHISRFFLGGFNRLLGLLQLKVFLMALFFLRSRSLFLHSAIEAFYFLQVFITDDAHVGFCFNIQFLQNPDDFFIGNPFFFG